MVERLRLGWWPGELTTPSALLTHTIKTTAGDTPLPVCWSVSLSLSSFHCKVKVHFGMKHKVSPHNKQAKKREKNSILICNWLPNYTVSVMHLLVLIVNIPSVWSWNSLINIFSFICLSLSLSHCLCNCFLFHFYQSCSPCLCQYVHVSVYLLFFLLFFLYLPLP